MSTKDGKCYTLRRLEGYRLTNEQAIRTFYPWKEVNNGSVVKIHEAFTTRDFGDSSLIFVTDYHPNSKTLAEMYIPTAKRYAQHIPQLISETAIWGWVVQFACALKAVHSAGLAVRALHPSKVLLTSKNRIRINGHAVLDVVKFDAAIPLEDQQQDDFVQLGHLIVSIATNTSAASNLPKAREIMTRYYTPKMKELVDWLLRTPNTNVNPPEEKTVDILLAGLTDEMVSTFDSQLHAEDTVTSTLMAELENGRLVRLMAKLGLINERPEFDHNTRWSETGERYQLRLFRDYVFHAVDAQGNPVTNLGHIITCLNKLDAGSLETVQLVSRDEQHQYIVSYKELKKGIETSFNELTRGRGH
jgi:PAB-dependent poly(A)-specific ribonuclease subunit 3